MPVPAALRGGQPFPSLVPAEVEALWQSTLTEVYGSDANTWLSSSTLNESAILHWIVLWLQTAGHRLMCQPPPLGDPPSGPCVDAPPDWATVIFGDNGSGGGPSGPTPVGEVRRQRSGRSPPA